MSESHPPNGKPREEWSTIHQVRPRNPASHGLRKEFPGHHRRWGKMGPCN